MEKYKQTGSKGVHNLVEWISEDFGKIGKMKDVVTYSSSLAERWFGKNPTKEQENEIIRIIDELRNIGLYIDSEKQKSKEIFCVCPDHISKADGTEIMTLAINTTLMQKLMTLFIFLLFIDDDKEARNVRNTAIKAFNEGVKSVADLFERK
jgi:hypothetical protein